VRHNAGIVLVVVCAFALEGGDHPQELGFTRTNGAAIHVPAWVVHGI
jgi:hypothetical protein